MENESWQNTDQFDGFHRVPLRNGSKLETKKKLSAHGRAWGCEGRRI